MKKWICLLMLLALLPGALSVFAQTEDMIILENDNLETEFFDEEFIEDDSLSGSSEDEWDLESLVPYDYQNLTIGNPTPLYGQFFTDLFGNDTSDADVRRLTAGYNLVTWDNDERYFRFDPSVVSNAVITSDEEQNRNYMIILYNDLYFSDGTPINAYSYAFSILLQSSPLMRELGADPAVYNFLKGYEDYAEGRTPYLAGVRVVRDNILLLTVKQEALPYFYELNRLAFYPYPISAIAPGCAVYDDGNGAYIGNADLNENSQIFTADLLKETILDEQTGYLSHPVPGSGPYTIVSYDGTDAVFEINPFYKGNEDGKKPRIKRLTYTGADRDTMIRDLSEGKYALLNKVTYSPDILSVLQLTMEQPQFTRSTYPRIGLTYIYFNPESELVQTQAVRQAIAYGLDKTSMIQAYAGNFGIAMDCLTGLGQWTYSVISGTQSYPVPEPEEGAAGEKAYEEAIEAWEELSFDGLTIYEFDPEESARVLDAAGWNLNEQGEAFDSTADTVRCKMDGDVLQKLDLRLGYPAQGFGWDELLKTYLTEPLSKAGVKITLIPLEIGSLVDAIKQREFEPIDIFYLGDNFNVSFDPAEVFRFSSALAGNEAAGDSLPAANSELLALTEEMDRTEPTELLEYAQKWLKFQERFTELVPMIPVYSNVYFDFYTRELTEYWIAENVTWADAIVPARMRHIKEINEDAVQVEATLISGAQSDGVDLYSWLEGQSSTKTDYSRGALSRFPEEVQDQVPVEYQNIFEFVAGTLNEELDEGDEPIDVNFAFQTPYPEGETVYLLFGIPKAGSDVEWIVLKGRGLTDNSISVLIDRSDYERLATVTFALAVVSK